MKYLLLILLFASCNTIEQTNKVEQSPVQDINICSSGHCIATYVWYNHNIIGSWFDDVQNPKLDSILSLRRKQGDSLINKLNKALN